MIQKKILIICFDTPFPTNYGGVYDIVAKFEFYKKNNIKIDLICSCFDESRLKYFQKFITENEIVIDNFHVEFIKPNPFDFLSKIPFSVKTRKFPYHKIDFLKNENYEFVLVEHLKSTFGINELMQSINNQPDLYLRIHNDEAEYYKNLYKTSSHMKRYFFLSESKKYKNYQNEVLKNSLFKGFLFISKSEMEKLSPKIPNSKFKHLLPVYADIQLNKNINQKTIDFLYVGNLDLDDNLNSLKKINDFLVQNSLEEFKLKIVGKCSDENRRTKVKNVFFNKENVDFQFNVNPNELKENYEKSKFFLNFSCNASGVKTKLIEAISHGIPVISNENGVEGSNFEDVVLMDHNLDMNWLKSSLISPEILEIYNQTYLKNIQSKINWIEESYNEFIGFKSIK